MPKSRRSRKSRHSTRRVRRNRMNRRLRGGATPLPNNMTSGTIRGPPPGYNSMPPNAGIRGPPPGYNPFTGLPNFSFNKMFK